MPTPLAIVCTCPSVLDVSLCQMISMQVFFYAGDSHAELGLGGAGCTMTGQGMHYNATFTDGSNVLMDFEGSGPTIVTDGAVAPGAWIPRWPQMQFCLATNNSLWLQPCDCLRSKTEYGMYVRFKYSCQNTTSGTGYIKYVDSGIPHTTGSCTDRNRVATYPKVFVTQYGFGTAFDVFFFCSSPFGGAGCIACSGGLEPFAVESLIDQDTSGGPLCVCATGGAGSYRFSVVGGRLPCGMTLNATTGCVDGDADGSCPGTDVVTFAVSDADGNYAEVDCGYKVPCPKSSGNAFY